MKLEVIPEPDLEFAKDTYICPRMGIALFDSLRFTTGVETR